MSILGFSGKAVVPQGSQELHSCQAEILHISWSVLLDGRSKKMKDDEKENLGSSRFAALFSK